MRLKYLLAMQVSCAAAFVLNVSACKTTEGSSDTKATLGVPEIYMGTIDPSRTKMLFYDIDPQNGRPKLDASNKPIIRLIAEVQVVSGNFLKIKGSSGPDLNQNPNATFSWFTNTPWTCGQAEEFLKGKPSTALDKDQKCYMEINTTGNEAFAVSLVGLGADGKGLTNWVNTNKPKDLKPGQLALVAKGPLMPGTVNALVDVPAVLAGMQELQKKFPLSNPQKVQERNTCLKNALATGWLDLQAHFYCIVDLNPHRTCYANKLVEARQKGAADPSNLTFKNPFGYAYKICFEPTGVIPKEVFPVFAYVMYTQTGVADFNIESANDVINQFYGVKQPSDWSKRPRRTLDTYPTWLPDQPRYNKIREMQLATQKNPSGQAGK